MQKIAELREELASVKTSPSNLLPKTPSKQVNRRSEELFNIEGVHFLTSKRPCSTRRCLNQPQLLRGGVGTLPRDWPSRGTVWISPKPNRKPRPRAPLKYRPLLLLSE